MYDYDRDLGVLRYRLYTDTCNGKPYLVNETTAGMPVETGQHGYVRCGVRCYNGRKFVWKTEQFAVHRMIWKIETGRDPEGVIDHIDGIRNHNRFINLRDVTITENARNIHIGLWRSMEERRKAKLEAEKQAAREAKEARRYARYLKLKAKYEARAT